ncbi:hypothetical protein EBR96_05655, partial [bacterium]|nr:hypothetical protein [bacterium]
DGLRAAMEINKLIDAKLAAAAKANRGISTTTHDIQLKLDLSALKAILKDKMETIGAHYTKETISGAKHAIAKMNAATPNELAQKTTDVTKQLTDMVRLLKAAKLSTTQAVELMKPVTEDAMRSFGARMTVLVSEISGERQLEKLAHLVGLAGALRDPILATIAPKDLISEMGSVHSGAQQAMSDSMKLLADAVSQKLTEARNDSANTIRKALAKTPPDYAAIKMERVRFETHDSEVTRGLAEMGGAATASTDLSSILDELKTEEKTVFKDTLSTRIRDLYKAFESNPKAVRAMFDDLVQRGKDLGLISLGTDGKIESTELPSKSISSLNKMAAGIRLADEFIALNATAAPLIKSFARGGRTSVSELTVVKTRLLNLNKGVNALKSDRLENGGPIVVFVNRVIMEDLEQRLGKVGVKGRASLTTRLSDCASAVAERETIFETARQLGVSADLKRIDNPTAVIDLDGRESLLRTLRTIAATSTDETNKAYAKQVVKLIGSTESQRIKGILAKIEAQFGPTVTLRNFNPEAYKHAVADLEQYSDRVVTDDDELDHGVGRFSSETISSERQRNIVGNKVEELEERLYEFEERLKSDLNKAVGQISAGRTDFDVRQFTAAVKAAKAGVAVLAKAGIITEFQKTEYNEKIHANVETALKSFSQIISKNYGTGADFGQINSALSQMEEVPGDITHPSWSADKASMYERAGQDIADVIHGRLQTAMNTASDPTILSKTIDRVFADLEKISPETRAKMGEHWKGAVQSIEYAIQSAIRDNASAIRHLGLPPAEVAPRFTACLALIESSKTALEKLKGFVSVASASVATSASRSGSSSPVPSSPSGSSPRSLPSVDSESDAELIGPATPSSVSVVSGDSGSASPIPDTKAHVIARVAEYVRRVADSLSFEGVVSSGLSAPASAVPAAMPWSSDSLSLRTPSSVEDFQAIQTLIELCKSGGMPVDDLAFKEPLKAVIKSQLPKPPDLPEVGRSLDGAFVDQFLAFSKQLDALAGNSGSSSQATSEVIREHKASIAKEIVAQFGNFTSLETQYSSEDIRLL